MAILTGSLPTGGAPKALIIDPNSVRASSLASVVQQAGYESHFVTNARDGFAQAAASRDFDLIFVDANVYDPELNPTLASLRSDPRTAAIPVLVVGSSSTRIVADPMEDSLRRADLTVVLEEFRLLGEKVDESKLDLTEKESIQQQINESARVLERLTKRTHMAPPSRVFMSLFIAELERIQRQIKFAKSNVADEGFLIDESEKLIGRVRAVATKLSNQALVDYRADTYPGERELSKFERRYPRVKYVARPESSELLKLQLGSFLPRLQAKPLTAAERADQARRAAAWLARIGLGEIRGFDIRVAEPALLAVLADDTIGPDAIVAASCIPTATAQSALLRLILSETASMPLRIAAAHQIANSLRNFGVLLPATEADELSNLLHATNEPAFHQAVAAALGAMKPNASEAGDRLRAMPTPPFQRDAAPVGAPPAPEPPPAPDPDPQP
jgi:CheY-like chemotaxis protein